MKKIRAIIADDEKPARNRIRQLLKAEADIEIVAETATGADTVEQVVAVRPELLFLDVQMPPPTGLGVLRALRDEHLPCTIFTTAYAEHALEAFAVHALDYLLKPFAPARFQEAVQRARAQIRLLSGEPDERLLALLQAAGASSSTVSHYLVRNNERYVVLPVEEVEWFESAANYIVAHTPNGNQVLRKSMTVLEGELDSRRFFRVSRGAIVRFACVRELQALTAGEHVVILKSGAKIPMTRNLRKFQECLAAAR